MTEAHRLNFAGAYLVASAESTGIDEIASFDRPIVCVNSVHHIQL